MFPTSTMFGGMPGGQVPAMPGYQPLFAGHQPPQFPGLFNFGSGPVGQMIGMFVQPFITNIFRQYGLQPLPILSQMNAQTYAQATQYYRDLSIATRVAGREDLASLHRTLMGAQQMIQGRALTPNERAQLFKVAESVQGALPYLSMFLGEGTLDFLFGSRGSAAGLARGVFAGTRGYFDPFSGGFGLSGELAGATSAAIFQRLYGTPQAVAQMRGVSAGQLGVAIKYLGSRGYLAFGDDTSTEERLRELGQMVFSRAQLRDMARSILEREGKKATPQSIDATVKELSTNLQLLRSGQITPGLAGQMRGIEELMGQFQAAKMERDLKNVARVVSAMRDLVGKPNAPVAQMLEALQQISAGALSQIDPGQLTHMVRRLDTAASNSGLGLQGIMALIGQAQQTGAMLGINPVLAPYAAAAAADYAQGYRASGTAARRGPGVATPDEQVRRRLGFVQQYMTSTAGNIAGMLSRLQSEMGNRLQGTRLGAMAAAVSAGRTTYTWQGREYQVPTTNAEVMAAFREAGLSSELGMAMLGNRQENQFAFTQNQNLGTLALQQQRNRVARDIARFVDAMGMRGVRGTEVAAALLSSKGKEDALDRLQDLGMSRTQALSIWERLSPQVRNYSAAGRRFNTLADLIAHFNDDAVAASQRAARINQNQAQLKDELAQLTSSGFTASVIDVLQRTKPGDDPVAALLKAFGGVAKDDPRVKAIMDKGLMRGIAQAISAAREAAVTDDKDQMKLMKYVLRGLSRGGKDAQLAMELFTGGKGYEEFTKELDEQLSDIDAQLKDLDPSSKKALKLKALRKQLLQRKEIAQGLQAVIGNTDVVDLLSKFFESFKSPKKSKDKGDDDQGDGDGKDRDKKKKSKDDGIASNAFILRGRLNLETGELVATGVPGDAPSGDGGGPSFNDTIA